jgi:hypothetical protein
MVYQLARYHAGKPILPIDETHPVPVPDRSPFVLGIEGVIDEIREQTKGTKFRISDFPSELSNGPAADRLAQYGEITKDTKTEKISRKDAKAQRVRATREET